MAGDDKKGQLILQMGVEQLDGERKFRSEFRIVDQRVLSSASLRRCGAQYRLT